MSKYKDAIASSMRLLATNINCRFVGYNVRHGLAGGVLKDVADRQLIETPVAENLMTGIAIGLALSGFNPVLYFERFDFVLNAADAIVNHLDKLPVISRKRFKANVIIRVVVGNVSKPLFTGPPHIQNYTEGFREMVNFPIIELKTPASITENYWLYADWHKTVMLVEFKDLY